MTIDLSPSDGCVERLSSPIGAGLLCGARLAVKDNIEVSGAIWSAGHKLFTNRRGHVTAPVVQTLTDAGANLVAMAATDAGGFGVTTPGVRNPLHPQRVVGGSSGGCAALVASGKADIALGTDTGGSVRIPAACTGLWGFKFQHGKVSNVGLWPMAPTFDTPGLITGNPTILLDAISLLVPKDDEKAPHKRRFGVCTTPNWARDRMTSRLFNDAVLALKQLGYETVELDLQDRKVYGECHALNVLAEAQKVYGNFTQIERLNLAPATQAALSAAEKLGDTERNRAADNRSCINELFDGFAQEFDAFLSPTLTIVPPKTGQKRSADGTPILTALTGETCLANLTGRAAITGPAGILPLQLIGLGVPDHALASLAPALFSKISDTLKSNNDCPIDGPTT